MTRLRVLVVVTSCIALTAATSMGDGYYADGETYPDVRQPRGYYPDNHYPANTWDPESYPRRQPYDQFGDRNGLQLEFNGNLKVYGNDVNRGSFGQLGKLYDTLTGYDGRGGGYDGGYGDYGDGYAGYDDGYAGYDGGYAGYDGGYVGYDGGDGGYDGRDGGYFDSENGY